MARKKPHAEHENHERWLVSYADFITLLFAFFVVMFASSQTDKAKAKQVSESVKEALENGGIKATVKEILGGTVDDKGKGNAQMRGPGGAQKQTNEPPAKTAELLPSMQYLNKSLEDEIKQGKLEVHLEARGLVISMRQKTFFPSGQDTIPPETYATVQKIADLIGKLPNPVRLEGHTDAIPIHTAQFRSNWELSTARAISMMNLLSGQFGLDSGRFAVSGYAENQPVDTNDTEEGRSHNRRVDIVILDQKALIKDQPAPAGKSAETKAAEPKSVATAKPPSPVK
jgi:chemotaxis protein MotB